ncbi:MAG: FHA domain-containing protein [Clostridiaceae bacterium]
MKNIDVSNNKNNQLLTTVQIINLAIGIILTLICILGYITIESPEIKKLLIVTIIIVGIIVFISTSYRPKAVETEAASINTIALVNEDNEIIKQWQASEKTSLLIGKSSEEMEADIDLSESIYSTLIDNQHAVMNFAAGKWYIEDLASKDGVIIQKIEDGIQYKLIKYSPCVVTKGDIVSIGKTKLLLK